MPNASHLVSTSPSQPTVAKPMVRLVAIIYDGMLILAMLFFGWIDIGGFGYGAIFWRLEQVLKRPKLYQIGIKNAIMTPSFVLTLVGFYGIFLRKSGQTLGMQTWRLKPSMIKVDF